MGPPSVGVSKGVAVQLTEDDAVRRVAMISVHTSPLDQPGTGDAGGLNVYVLELSRRLAAAGIEVDIFTRSTSSRLDPIVAVGDRIKVRNIHAGPFEGLAKGELPGQLCVFAREVLRTEAAQPLGHYDLVHSHYWLSGQVGALARDRWGVPLVHTMHTMAKVKNEALAAGDTPEPSARIIGEEQVVEAADMLIASTDIEAKQLINLYDADPGRVEVVHPGVDLAVFRPRDTHAAREQLGLPLDAHVVLFAGRLQPLKAPDVLLRAVALLLGETPALRSRLVVPVVGGPSGTGLEHPESLAELASELGIDDVVRFVPPVPVTELAVWDAAASVVAVPSYNESFGLVAAEALATGTPVVAAAVGGLTTVVEDEENGLLVDTHEPRDWAAALRRVLLDDALRARLSQGARARSARFSWENTAERTLDVYERARAALREPV
jgi:D-inositol-3-phosphate glycosyltransferase